MDKAAAAKNVIITGASSGIGYELARLFARDGYRLLLLARKEEPLRKAAHELKKSGAMVEVMAIDLGRANAAQKIFDYTVRKKIAIDVLVNNAGYGGAGFFHKIDWQQHSDMIQVNVVAAAQLCRLFLPGMIQRGHGRILNVASTAAFQPGPMMGVYYATKAFLLSLSLALSAECAGTGVTVTALCPGPTLTKFLERANIHHTRLVRFKVMPFIDADKVAVAGYQGLDNGKKMVVPGVMNKIGVLSIRIMPRSMALAVIKSLHRKTS